MSILRFFSWPISGAYGLEEVAYSGRSAKSYDNAVGFDENQYVITDRRTESSRPSRVRQVPKAYVTSELVSGSRKPGAISKSALLDRHVTRPDAAPDPQPICLHRSSTTKPKQTNQELETLSRSKLDAVAVSHRHVRSSSWRGSKRHRPIRRLLTELRAGSKGGRLQARLLGHWRPLPDQNANCRVDRDDLHAATDLGPTCERTKVGTRQQRIERAEDACP